MTLYIGLYIKDPPPGTCTFRHCYLTPAPPEKNEVPVKNARDLALAASPLHMGSSLN